MLVLIFQLGAKKSSMNEAMHEVVDPSYERVILRLNRGPSVHCREYGRCSSTRIINEPN
jgi:hypothetical protein